MDAPDDATPAASAEWGFWGRSKPANDCLAACVQGDHALRIISLNTCDAAPRAEYTLLLSWRRFARCNPVAAPPPSSTPLTDSLQTWCPAHWDARTRWSELQLHPVPIQPFGCARHCQSDLGSVIVRKSPAHVHTCASANVGLGVHTQEPLLLWPHNPLFFPPRHVFLVDPTVRSII